MKQKTVRMAVLVTFLTSLLLIPLGVQPTSLVGAEEPTLFPDLELGYMLSDLPFPSTNQNVMIVAQIFNNGPVDVTSVQVNFYTNSSLIGCTTTSVLVGTLNETSVSWAPASPGVYNVTVVVDPLDELVESNENNNVLSEFVFVEPEWPVEGTGTYFESTSSENLDITSTSSYITITPDAVYPASTPITKSDNVYTFDADINETIIVAADNIVINGNGYTLEGPGSWVYSDGFYLDKRSSNVTIKNVVITGWTSRGINLYFWDPVAPPNTSIIGNTITGNNYGIYGFHGIKGVFVSENTITNNRFGFFFRGSSITISENTITNNRENFLDGSLNTISGNIIAYNTYGLTVQSFSYNNISGNTITTCGIGIWFWSSLYNNISGNTFTANSFQGIYIVDNSDNNVFYHNNITNNRDGFYFSYGCDNNVFSHNNITNNKNGIFFVGKSTNNVFYHNNIIGNTQYQARDYYSSFNNYHHPELLEGNYWSDYPGADDGSGTGKHAIEGDGIGDTSIPWPKQWPPDAVFDNYPFMEESGWVIVHVTVTIDIKPGSDPNSVCLSDQGLLPVAILGTTDFDTTTIDPTTLELGGADLATRGPAKAPKLAYSFEDVSGELGVPDGIPDMMVFFGVQDLIQAGALDETTTELALTATLLDGTPIVGTDSVRVVPP